MLKFEMLNIIYWSNFKIYVLLFKLKNTYKDSVSKGYST